MKKRASIIVNPSSGKEKGAAAEAPLVAKLQQLYEAVDVLRTTPDISASRLAIEACTHEADLIAVVGGDGTVSEVVNGMMNQTRRPVLLFVPTGTVNVLARALDIPFDLEKMLDDLETYVPQAIDVGQINDAFFVNSVSFGAVPSSLSQVPAEEKTEKGMRAYIEKGYEALKEQKKIRVILHYNGMDWTDTVAFGILGLSSYIATIPNWFPDAKVDDGRIYGMMMTGTGMATTAKMAAQVVMGKVEQVEEVHYFETKTIRIDPVEEEILTNIDGNPGPALPVEIQVHPQALVVLVPPAVPV